MIIEITDSIKKQEIASQILHALPDWFGLPESTAEYICQSAAMPFWADIENGSARGFIVLKPTSPYAAEIYVMGVAPQYHRMGIGRALVEAFCSYARSHGFGFAHVKTVQQGHYPEYDQTNAFYRSVGFHELECLPQLWDESNPCQLFVMAL